MIQQNCYPINAVCFQLNCIPNLEYTQNMTLLLFKNDFELFWFFSEIILVNSGMFKFNFQVETEDGIKDEKSENEIQPEEVILLIFFLFLEYYNPKIESYLVPIEIYLPRRIKILFFLNG